MRGCVWVAAAMQAHNIRDAQAVWGATQSVGGYVCVRVGVGVGVWGVIVGVVVAWVREGCEAARAKQGPATHIVRFRATRLPY